MPPSRLRQLIKFIRVFGLAPGSRLWWAVLRHRADSQTGRIHLPVPGLIAPLQVRERDLPIFWQIWVMRENDFGGMSQSAGVQALYRQSLSSGRTPVIVDCGGHVGLSAVWFASQFPKATVYSIEPSDANYAMLQANSKAYRNIVPLNGGVWSRSCHLEISNPDSGSASFRLREVDEPENVDSGDLLRAYTIDEVAGMVNEGQLLLVKIDIEGAESEVFRAPGPWLESVAAIVIELHDWLLPGQGTSANFFRSIAGFPFDVILQGENLLVFRTQAQGSAQTGTQPTNIEPALVS